MTIVATNKTAAINSQVVQSWSNYIVVTGLDTTAAYNGPVIDISQEDVVAVFGTAVCTASSGAANLVILLQGGNQADGSDFSTLKDNAGNDISSGNIAIASPTVTGFFDSVKNPRYTFPPYIRIRYTLSANGWTGVVALSTRKANGVRRV